MQFAPSEGWKTVQVTGCKVSGSIKLWDKPLLIPLQGGESNTLLEVSVLDGGSINKTS